MSARIIRQASSGNQVVCLWFSPARGDSNILAGKYRVDVTDPTSTSGWRIALRTTDPAEAHFEYDNRLDDLYRDRSKTYEGIARAMARQWGGDERWKQEGR